METRIISFAGSTVAIEHEGPLAASIVDFLFAALPPSPPPSVVATYTLTPGEGADRLRLLRNGIMLYEGFGRGVTADTLLGHASFDLADKSTGGMLFHSGALAWKGGLILLPAGIGSGKSTFTLWMTTKGFGYLSDESAFVPEGSDRAVPFRRPLSLKNPSRDVAKDFFDLDAGGDRILPSMESELIHPSLLAAGPADSSLPVRLVIFPRYSPDAEPAWEPLTAARTAQELMQSLVNARNLPGHGFSEAVRLAKGVKGFRIVYSNFGQIAERLDELLDVRGE